MPRGSPPRCSSRALGTVFLLTCALAGLVLRADSRWVRGVVGDGDAWQNLWNLRSVDRELAAGCSPFRSTWVWAPEGASLSAHTLSPVATVPGAVLGRLAGFPLAHNLLVVLWFGVAGAGAFRLARHLGLAALPALVAALAFAFFPQRTARALGHLNLLSSALIPWAVDAAYVLFRSRRGLSSVLALSTSVVALALADWYMTLTGLIAVAALTAHQLVRWRVRRRRSVLRLALAAAVALPIMGPLAWSLARADGPHGHDATWCGTAITSLVIPTRTLMISDLTGTLTNRNHQSPVEGAGYLGWGPLLALGAALLARKRPAALGAITAGGVIALMLSLGPRLRIFDDVLDVPLPYALLERVAPVLAIGGCVNRLQVGMALPLALALGLACGWLFRSSRAFRVAGVALLAFTAVEYAPRDPGVAEWPYWPEDRAMSAIRESPEPGAVLDADRGFPALVRQMRHGRPQTFGFLSRTPESLLRKRLEDPAIDAVVGSGAPSVTGPPLALRLATRWQLGFVVLPDEPASRERAARLGLEPFAEEPGRSLAFRLPQVDPPPAHLSFAELASVPEVYAEGLYGPETIPIDETPTAGCWTNASVSLSFVASPGIPPGAGSRSGPTGPPGTLVLDLAGPGPDSVPVTIRLGAFTATWSVRGRSRITIPVEPASLAPRGIVTLHISAPPLVAPPDPRTLGVFLISLERR